MEVINLYPESELIDLKGREDNDPQISEKINLYKVPNALITSYGYTIKNFSVLEESISFRHRKTISFKNIISFVFLKRKISVQTTAISIANGWYDSYYHFTLECLPKLFLMRDFIDKATLIFPSKISKFHQQWFDLLGVTKIKYINNDEIVKTPLALTCNFPERDLNHHNIILPEFRNWILEHINNKDSIGYKKIFIGRKNPMHRKLLNLEEVKTTLQNEGFTYVEMEDFSIADQIKLFYNAEQIVCLHGAALSNLCFSKPKTKVLDLIHKQFKQWCFLKMSIILDIDYAVFSCSGTNNNAILPGHQDISVDISKLTNILKKWSL